MNRILKVGLGGLKYPIWRSFGLIGCLKYPIGCDYRILKVVVRGVSGT